MVRPNRWYGVRSEATLRDEALWYAANRAAGRDLVVAGSGNLVLSVALPQLGVGGVAYVLLMVIALAAGVALVVLTNLARLRALHRLPL